MLAKDRRMGSHLGNLTTPLNIGGQCVNRACAAGDEAVEDAGREYLPQNLRNAMGVGGKVMFRVMAFRFAVAGCLVSCVAQGAAQQVVHALTGTVSSISDATKTITVFQDSGSSGVFKMMSDSRTRIDFDKKVAAGTTRADAFNTEGAYAIVFYFGDDDDRRVVALKSLGKGPFTSTVGTVAKFEAHGRSISVVDNTGAVKTFRISAATVAEGGAGVEEGFKLQVEKGARVRVVSSMEDGTPTALFVREM